MSSGFINNVSTFFALNEMTCYHVNVNSGKSYNKTVVIIEKKLGR